MVSRSPITVLPRRGAAVRHVSRAIQRLAPGAGCQACGGIDVAWEMGMRIATSARDVAAAAPDDRLEELQSELSQVEWFGNRLRIAGRRRDRSAVDESSLWSRLLAWTQ
jgi:hypothetical protein